MTDSVHDMLLNIFGDDLRTSDNSATEWTETDCIQDVMELKVENENLTTLLTQKLDNSVEPSLEDVSDGEFKELFRMKKSTTFELQKELSNSNIIDKNLLFCLWFLGNTKSLREISQIFDVTEEFVVNLCEQYFTNIIKLLDKYVQWPILSESLVIENGFRVEYGFPGIVGVIGNLHIEISMTEDDPEAKSYFNKNSKKYTIVLQFVCDNVFLFRDIFVGYPGGSTIPTILKASPLYKRLMEESSVLVKSKKYLLGGTEHPQMLTLLTPYIIPKFRVPTRQESKYNTLHSKVMSTVEKTFRMVEKRFPRIRSLDGVGPEFGALVAGTICILHNFCRIRHDNY